MKKYLEDLKTALNELGFGEQEIADILRDHEEMITEAIAGGLAEQDIEQKFGSPEKVAHDLSDMCRHGDIAADPSTEGWNPAGKFAVPDEKFNVLFRLASEDLTVEKGEGSEIAVFTKGRGSLDQFEFGFFDGQFVVRRKSKTTSSWFHREGLDFLIRIPANAKVGTISQHTASGDFVYSGVTSEGIEVNTASGDGFIRDCACQNFAFHAVNGDLHFVDVTCIDMTIGQVSGDVRFERAHCTGDIEINNTSGDVTLLDSECKRAFFHTVSGDLEGTEFYPESVELRSVSGDISIHNKDFTRKIIVTSAKSVSGSVRI
ncbi:MAG: DUF4097 family beta strand repeat-containing protein [bacterium]